VPRRKPTAPPAVLPARSCPGATSSSAADCTPHHDVPD
jgi:hypothetical protein